MHAHPATEPSEPGEPVGIFYMWRPGGLLPHVDVSADALIRVAPDIDASRTAAPGDRRYRVTTDDSEIASGWVSTQRVEIGELGVTAQLPQGHIYLWGYETLPDWRGRGIYPMLLQELLRREAFLPGISHAWIGHDVGNEPSASGILRAGFTPVARVDRVSPDSTSLRMIALPGHDLAIAQLCATVFGIQLNT